MAGPYPGLRGLTDGDPSSPSAPRGKQWQWMGEPRGDLDLVSRLRLGPTSSEAALAGGWLMLPEALRGWFLLASDGIAVVTIDGKPVHSRSIPRARGRGWDVVPVSLDPGWHSVILALERRSSRLAFRARWLDGKTGQAPVNARWIVPSSTELTRRLASTLVVEPSIDLSLGVPALVVKIAAPAGVSETTLVTSLELVGNREPRSTLRFRTGSWKVNGTSPAAFLVRVAPLGDLASLGDSLELRVGVDQWVWKGQLNLDPKALDALVASEAQLTAGLDRVGEPTQWASALLATIQYRAQRLTSRLLGAATPEEVATRTGELTALLETIRSKQTPLFGPGVHELALPSAYDQRPQPFLLHVPKPHLGQPDAEVRYPLVVVLHGYNSTPQRALRAFLDQKGTLRPRVNGFVLAPAAHGNSFYRGAGEASVLSALDFTLAQFPVDPDRVAITGASMGGTGAAEIALHHVDRFSAAAPLCGYHSYFVRRDTQGQPLLPWERALMHRFSTTSWADSGLHLPLYVAQGTKDLPLSNSQVLVERYKKLGYSLKEEWPELGHDVWKQTYAKARMWDWLVPFRRATEPRRVVFTTPSYRYAKAYWVELTGLAEPGKFGRVEAIIGKEQTVRLKTTGVTGVHLLPNQHVDPHRSLLVDIDGEQLTVPAEAPLYLVKTDHWQTAVGPPPDLRRGRGLEGPWAELWNEPVMVVFGSQNPATAAINRDVARTLATPAFGVDLQIPVVSDAEYDPVRNTAYRALYVGRPDDHRWLARIAARLPIRVQEDGLQVGATRFEGPDVGAVFVYPDPDRPGALLGVVTAVGAAGLYHSLSLPALIPDFLVFDTGVLPAESKVVLGTQASVLRGGFFGNQWELPAVEPP